LRLEDRVARAGPKPYQALRTLPTPLKGLIRPSGPYKALQGLTRPSWAFMALEGLTRFFRVL